MTNVVQFQAERLKSLPVCYTIKEAAEALRLSRTTIYQMIKDGSLKTVRVGCFQRVPAGEIDRILTPSPLTPPPAA